MAKSPAFPWYARDFALDTQAMTAEEVGVYVRLLNACWIGIEGAPQAHLVADEGKLQRIAGVTTARWRACRDAVLPKFIRVGGWLASKRMLVELEKQREKSAKAGDSARRRWSAEPATGDPLPVQNGCETDANALRTQCETDAESMHCILHLASASSPESPLPFSVLPSDSRSRPPERARAPGSGSDGALEPGHAASAFERFFSRYPNHRGRAEAERAWSEVEHLLLPEAEMFAVLDAQIAADSAADPVSWRRFFPQAAKWLRGKRWREIPQGFSTSAAAAEGEQDARGPFRRWVLAIADAIDSEPGGWRETWGKELRDLRVDAAQPLPSVVAALRRIADLGLGTP